MPRRIVLYSKPGCHLCENVSALLLGLEDEFDLRVEETDITGDRELFKKYFDKIPVLIIDDRTTLAAPITLQDLRAALESSRD